mmetsp:Transcript_45881/g.110080  ORF Transcript_45881/g.110080 Transcript_45881/m.110080 type:complete len:201 (+) Transcript_45881:110-712(+)
MPLRQQDGEQSLDARHRRDLRVALPGGAPLFQRDAAVAVDVDLREDLVHQRVHLSREAVDHAIGERGGLRTQRRRAALRAAASDEARLDVRIAPTPLVRVPAQLVPHEQRQYGAHQAELPAHAARKVVALEEARRVEVEPREGIAHLLGLGGAREHPQVVAELGAVDETRAVLIELEEEGRGEHVSQLVPRRELRRHQRP